ncbi:hypothetical protein GGI15_003958 [Coemansia interrupta]|uniref:Tetratricopeptide repeat protein n=1 Tax=Coemansia interrupta TaxID=1126814 RepID=A0A9W8LF87_9FUNG|nr:hypothetical protein GGI15_003958 [Coemansia interrupta]
MQVQQLRWASSIPEDSISQLTQQAQSQLEQGNTQEAYNKFLKILSLHPSADSHFSVGVCAYMLNRVDEALDMWERTLQINPDHSDAHVNLGSIYFLKKQNGGKAVEHLERARELVPNDAEVMFNLAAVYDSLGRLDEAKTLFEKCVERGIKNADVFLRNVNAKLLKKSLEK